MGTSEESDLFFRAIHRYEEGDFLGALRMIISSPDVHYDDLISQQPEFRYLVNYVEAMVFGGRLETVVTRKALFDEIEKNAYLKIVLHDFIELLEEENILGNDCSTSLKKIEVEKVSSNYRSFIQEKITLWDTWEQLLREKPILSTYFFGVDPVLKMPWHRFAYDAPINPLVEKEEGIPFILLEPNSTIDYAHVLAPYIGKKAIYVCTTYAEFMHLLQWKTVVQAFASPESILYILEGHPKEQLEQQIVDRTLCLVVLTSRKAVIDTATLLKQALESSNYNWLYNITKRLLFRIRAERLGMTRSFALHVFQMIQDWFDPHKTLPPADADLGPMPRDFLGEIYSAAARERVVRQPVQRKRHIAHVVSQIVDGGHAPTMLLKNLLTHGSHDQYEITLISTERMTHYPLEYPVPWRDSSSSLHRGAQTIAALKAYGVKVLVNTRFVHYEATARYLAGMMNLSEYDVVVFHGPDETNNMIGSLSNAPLRVLFDHGTLPSYPCYDLVIVSSEDALRLHRERLQGLGMDMRMLMFCIDVRKGWDTRVYSKEELGFPADSFIMTTISHHLNARLSDEMCHAIAEILQRNPHAYYAPIGPIHKEEKFRAFFSQYNVGERVVFMGNRQHPSQLARTMQLYLNEFPFGSGIGILDAMAAGCPVVSMFDEHGPQQARYGGTYFGVDRVVTSGKREDYVALACKMIQDKEFYEEASQHALKLYELRVNEEKYAKDFEFLVESVVTRA